MRWRTGRLCKIFRKRDVSSQTSQSIRLKALSVCYNFFHQSGIIFPKTRKGGAIFTVVSMDEVTTGSAAQAVNVQVCLILLFTWGIYFDVAYTTFSSEFSKYETGKVGKF